MTDSIAIQLSQIHRILGDSFEITMQSGGEWTATVSVFATSRHPYDEDYVGYGASPQESLEDAIRETLKGLGS